MCSEFFIAFRGDGLAQRKAYINGKIIADIYRLFC